MLDFFRNADKAASLDATGIGLSALCIVQCLLFPAAAVAAPLLTPGFAEYLGASHEWHIGLLAVAAPVSLTALIWGARTTRAGWKLVGAGVVGLILMAIGAAHVLGEVGEVVITLIGVSILAVAHVANWRARRAAGTDQHLADAQAEATDPS